MPKSLMQALLLSAALAAAYPCAAVATDAGSVSPKPVATQQRLSTAKFGTVLPIASVGASQGLFAELETHVDPGVTAIVIESGTFTLSELVAAAAGKQLQGAVQKRGDVFRLMAPLVIWKGAELQIGSGEQLFLDGEKFGLVLNAGMLTVEGASIDASGFPEAGNPFRPFVLTVAEGGASIRHSQIRNLGYGSLPETSGLSFLGRGVSLSGPPIDVTDNTLSNLVSLSLVRAHGSIVSGNRLSAMRSSGIEVQSTATATVLNNRIVSSERHGIRVTSRSQQVNLEANEVSASKGHGIFVDDGSVLVSVKGNRIEKSGLSGIVVKGSGCSTVSDNLVASNKLSGIRAEASFGVAISANFILGNRDGISLEEQVGAMATDIHGNAFSRNVIGIRSDGRGDLRLATNDFSAQWPRLFGGAMAVAAGRYLSAHDIQPGSEFIVAGKRAPAVVRLASFSAFGLAACTTKAGG